MPITFLRPKNRKDRFFRIFAENNYSHFFHENGLLTQIRTIRKNTHVTQIRTITTFEVEYNVV